MKIDYRDSEQFKAARKRLGLTQEQLAEKLGCSERAVQHYEAKSRKIPRPIAKLMASLVTGDRNESR